MTLRSFSQKEFHLVYLDSTTQSITLPDSLSISFVQFFQSQGAQGNVADSLAKSMFSQLVNKKYYQIQERQIRANNKFTVIVFDRFTKEGSMDIQSQDDSLLLKNEELYEDAPTETGFSKTPLSTAKKEFSFVGNTRIILKHICKEYFSTDSTCRIWIAEDLPFYINPGIITGKTNGAILAFELKTESFFTKSEAIKIK